MHPVPDREIRRLNGPNVGSSLDAKRIREPLTKIARSVDRAIFALWTPDTGWEG